MWHHGKGLLQVLLQSSTTYIIVAFRVVYKECGVQGRSFLLSRWKGSGCTTGVPQHLREPQSHKANEIPMLCHFKMQIWNIITLIVECPDTPTACLE